MEAHLSERSYSTRRGTITAAHLSVPIGARLPWCVAFTTVIKSHLPVFASLLANVISTSITMAFVSGQYNSTTEAHRQSIEVAAVSLGLGINNCVLRTFVLGYDMGMMTLAAQGLGQGKTHKIPEYVNRTILSGACLMVVLDGIMLLLQQVFRWIRIEEEALDSMITFSRITLVGFYFQQWFDVCRQYMNAHGMFLLHFWTAFMGMLANLVGCYFLVGRERLNMVGAGISNDLQMLTNFTCIFLTVTCCKRVREKFRRPSGESCREWLPIIKIGVPSYIMMLMDLSSLEIFVILSNYVSVNHLSANGVLLNIFYLSIIFSYALVQCVGPLIGQSIGAGHVAKAKRYGVTGWLIGMSWSVVYALLCLLLTRDIFGLLDSNPVDLDIIENSVPYVAACILLDHSQVCLSSVVVGLGKQRKVAKVNILIYYCVGIPLGCVLTFVADFHDGGFWVGLAASFVLVNVHYALVIATTDFQAVVQQIAARMASVRLDDEDDEGEDEEEDSGLERSKGSKGGYLAPGEGGTTPGGDPEGVSPSLNGGDSTVKNVFKDYRADSVPE